MNPITKSSNDLVQNGKFSVFHKVNENEFFINSACIFSHNQTIKKNMIYDLIDLKENGGMHLAKFKLMDAFLNGFNLFVVGIDTKTGLVLQRSIRLDYSEKPCEWFLIAQDYLQPDENTKGIEDYCDEN